MKHRLPRKKDRGMSAMKTFSLAEPDRTDPISGTTIPSESGVIEAKHFVEENKK